MRLCLPLFFPPALSLSFLLPPPFGSENNAKAERKEERGDEERDIYDTFGGREERPSLLLLPFKM